MKLSIITVCHNSKSTIRKTIESVLRQKENNMEYIIIDGGSTDGTIEIVKSYGTAIDLFISEKDEGISDAFNKGIKYAQGEIIGIINSDDEFLYGALRHVVDSMSEDTDVFFGNGIHVKKNGCSKLIYANPDPKELYIGMSMFHPGVFIRKRAYIRYGCFDKSYRFCMDRELLVRFFSKGAMFEYSDYYYAIYHFGGASDVNYINGVIPEKREISMLYGMEKNKANLINIKSIVLYFLSQVKQKFSCNNCDSLEDIKELALIYNNQKSQNEI